MSTTETCPDCGGPLSAMAGGLCPRCLAESAVAFRKSESAATTAEDCSLDVDGPVPAVKPENWSRGGPQLSRKQTEHVGRIIGRYKLVKQIGEGGCGVVYAAEQDQPVRRRVALKIIKLGMDTRQVIARFEAERQALALMDHPNIARVLDAGETDAGRPYFVMELVQGDPLTDYCDKHALDLGQRIGLFIQVCHAIQHAHQRGIIHRDIKPSNILVAESDGLCVPKIIDFGIAKAITNQRLTDKTLHTAIEQFLGTPAYMSPEQAQFGGRDVDRRTDIYSLGVLLYELLTGRTPFEARPLLETSLDEIRRAIRDQEPSRPSTKLKTLSATEQAVVASRRQCEPPKLLRFVSGDLDWIVLKALEKNRNLRYGTASGLASDLERYLNNEPVSARPPSVAYRFQKVVRRNKLIFGAGVAVLAALYAGLMLGQQFAGGRGGWTVVAAMVSGLGLFTWLFIRERRARKIAVDTRAALAAAAEQPLDSRATPVASIAVLPLVNLTSDPVNESLGDGIVEDLITALSRVPGLRVPARMSAFAFKGKSRDIREIGRILNVETVLEGSVRKDGDRVRVAVQLLKTTDGFQLWADSFDRKMEDVFRTQDEIAQAIAQGLTQPLTGGSAVPPFNRYRPSSEVYMLYLRGRSCMERSTQEGCLLGIPLLKQAVEADPNYPLPYLSLALAHTMLCHYGYLPPKEAMPQAKAAVLRALELDGTLAEAHAQLGGVLFQYDWDWPGAERELRRALELCPNSLDALHHYGYFLWAMGRYEESLARLNRAVEADPLSPLLNMNVVWPLISLGRYEEAIQRCEKLIAFEPHFWGAYRVRALTRMAMVMRADVLGQKEQALAEAALDDCRKTIALGGGPVALAQLGGFLGYLGRSDEAQSISAALAALPHVTPYCWIMMYTGLSDRPRLLEWWQKAIEYRDPVLSHYKSVAETWWPRNRDLPVLLKQIGL